MIIISELIRGPNPFAIEFGELLGRKEEMQLFRGLLSSTTSGNSELMVVMGSFGIGKTALFRAWKVEAEKNGLRTFYVRVNDGDDSENVVEKIVQSGRFENAMNLDSIIMAIEKQSEFGAVIFLDDCEKMKAEGKNKTLGGTLGQFFERVKLTGKHVSLVLGSLVDLDIVGDKKILLKPFSEHDVREFVEKALKKEIRMGEECLTTITSDSSGNPKMIRTICRCIYEKLRENEKVINKGHYLEQLSYIMSTLSSEWFGQLYQIPEAERKVLYQIAINENLPIKEIAQKSKMNNGPANTLAQRLLQRGHIVRLGRGRYRVFSRLYGKYVIERFNLQLTSHSRKRE